MTTGASIVLILILYIASLLFGHHSFGKSKPNTISFFTLTYGSQLLGFATEELSIRVGQTIGGLLNATLVGPLFRLVPNKD
jgi:Ca2+:H+ antiporter